MISVLVILCTYSCQGLRSGPAKSASADVPEDHYLLLAAAAQAPAWKMQAKFIEITGTGTASLT